MGTPRQFPIGAELSEKGASFRVWSPRRKRVDLVLEGRGETQMSDEGNGYFSAQVNEATIGTRYGFRLDRSDKVYPDPASRFQPDGPHGLSEVVSREYRWRDGDWKGITPQGQVLYEMHVGTFTAEGTWAAAALHLPYLQELGVTCIEMMPIADFAGRWGWGYDGVDLFAPTRLYGQPDDLRRFIDTAHEVGIGVILDVVYNHFGPDGNYLMEFGPYMSDKHKNDWGQSINFDAPDCGGVREFVLTNARYWIEEFHFDGYRFDATQAIVDDSKQHILAAIARVAREAARGRSIYLVCENEPQHTRLVRPPERGGYGMDTLWNDDFHHSAMVVLSGRAEAYLADYSGKAQEFVSAAKWGYLYQGQIYKWQGKRRGTPTFDLPPSAFAHFIQNHDQIANYAYGYRAHHLSGLALYRAMSALMLLMPQIPLLFQGQEYAADRPFNYFADHSPELGKLIRAGRIKEHSQFPSVAQPEVIAKLPDPSARETFEQCKLDLAQRDMPVHKWIYRLYRDVLRIRREEPAFSEDKRMDFDGAVLGHESFVLRYIMPDGDDRLLLANFDSDVHLDIVPEPLLGAPENKQWAVLWSSEHPRYGGNGHPPPETGGEDWRLPGVNWTILGRSVSVLRPVPRTFHHLSYAKDPG